MSAPPTHRNALPGRSDARCAPPAPPPVARRLRATSRLPAAAAAGCFITTVVAANALTARYGLVPVGLGMSAAAGTWAAGLSLLTRDWVHHTAGRAAVLVCITAGALASAALAGPRLAVASAAAFAVSEMADLLVYQRLLQRGWRRAVVVSTAVGAPIDTALFLTLAGMPVWAALPGQLWVKAAVTIIAVTTVDVVLRHRLRPPGP